MKKTRIKAQRISEKEGKINEKYFDFRLSQVLDTFLHYCLSSCARTKYNNSGRLNV